MRLRLSDDERSGLSISRIEKKEIAQESQPVQKNMLDGSDVMRALHMLILATKESQDKDRAITRESIDGMMQVIGQPEKAPTAEQWEFDIVRDKDGSLKKIIAKQILGN